MSIIKNHHALKGIFWAVVSCFFSGIMVNMVKHVSHDLHTVQIIFIRNLFAFMMFLPIVAFKGKDFFKTQRLGLHILRSSTGMLSMMIYFYGISIMNISVVTAISFTAPIFTAILAIFFFNDKPNIHQIFGFFMGLVGCLIVIHPGAEGYDPNSLIVLCSAVFWAFSGIIIKKLSQTEAPLKTTFYMTLIMTFMSAPLAFYHWNAPSAEDYMWVLGIAFTSNFLQYGIAKSLSHADLSVLLPFDFLRMFFSAGFAYIIFGERLDYYAAVGSIVIMCSAVYSVFNERRKYRRQLARTTLGKTF